MHRFWYEAAERNLDGKRLPILSSRVRLARNIRGLPFPSRMGLAETLTLRTSIQRFLRAHDFSECKVGQSAEVSPSDFLVSIIAQGNPACAIGHAGNGQVVVIGDEDHFRLSTVVQGAKIDDAMTATFRLERLLAMDYTFAYDANRFGYLTASLANAGLAMRVSVWMHVPALLIAGKWTEIVHLLISMDISVRGIMGEDSDVKAGMVQLSNRTSYGRSAAEVTAKLRGVIELVDDAEREALAVLLREHRSQTFSFLAWMNVLEQPFVPKDDFVHAISAALLASRLGYNVRFDSSLALHVVIAGFKSIRQDGIVQMQVVRNLMRDTITD